MQSQELGHQTFHKRCPETSIFREGGGVAWEDRGGFPAVLYQQLEPPTCDGAMHLRAILQFDGDSLVAQLHQKPAERTTGKHTHLLCPTHS